MPKIQKTAPSAWLQFAKENLMAAEVLYNAGLYNQVCFHAQQSIERSIKAFLFSEGLEVPKICRVEDILKIAIPFDENLEHFKENANWVDKYYASTRYPDTPEEELPQKKPGKEDAQQALRIANDFYNYIIGSHFKGKKIVLLFQ